MSKLLYSLKMVLLGKQINELPVFNSSSIFSGQQLAKLQKFTNFVVFCYLPWWLTAPLPTTAPINDLHLINTLLEYKTIEPEIAAVALKAVKGHLCGISLKRY